MFLSRIQINPARRGARALLGSPQKMHAAVLASFQEDGAERGRVLWRVDRENHKVWLYVVSRPQPDFAHIIEQCGWHTTQASWDVRPYGNLLDRLTLGQQWAFRLTANPTRTTRAAGPLRLSAAVELTGTPKRYGHVTVDQQLDWLLSRAPGWGINVGPDGSADVVVHDRRTERFNRAGNTVTIAKATFDGRLTVTDVDLLRAALVDGVGPAKAYGCGLLTLAPVSST